MKFSSIFKTSNPSVTILLPLVVLLSFSSLVPESGWCASTVNVSRDHVMPQPALALGKLDISGADMGSLVVTAIFGNTSQEAISWDANKERATGTNWALAQSGDSKSKPWTLFNNSGVGIIALLLDGVPGNVVFDVIADDKGSNSNDPSGFGTPFSVLNDGGVGQIDLKYWKPVGLNGVSQFSNSHDLYAGVRIDFSGALPSGSVFSFLIDTDLVTYPPMGDQGGMDPDEGGMKPDNGSPGTTPVPEPQTVLLFGTGLLILLATNRFLNFSRP
ncbi:MAG: PEP-CTERM sorting domain-containing protein [Nitrospirota bacterium]|nr:PEP-CTERM sorting domain-containing protein [Nitrospirota bacterium]